MLFTFINHGAVKHSIWPYWSISNPVLKHKHMGSQGLTVKRGRRIASARVLRRACVDSSCAFGVESNPIERQTVTGRGRSCDAQDCAAAASRATCSWAPTTKFSASIIDLALFVYDSRRLVIYCASLG